MTLDLLTLHNNGVRQLRGLGFVFQVAKRQVMLQRCLWPPFEGGTCSSDHNFILTGIVGLMPLAGMPGLGGAMSRRVLEVTTIVVPQDAWKIIMVGDPARWQPLVPAPEHPIPLVTLAAAVESLDGANSRQGDVVQAYPLDDVLAGYNYQALLYGVPEMIAKGLAAVQ